MTPVLSRAQMRAYDEHAIRTCGVPSLVLMENAGRGATEVLVREMLSGDARGARVVVVCGTGNNGGDGFVVARQLLVRGAEPIVVLVGDAANASRDARANLDAWRGLGRGVRELATGASLAPLADSMRDARVVVDALFGTGLDRSIEGWLAEVVDTINAARAPRFAVDLPSGLDADTGAPLGVCVEAAVTVTFAHPKLGLLTPRGASFAGRVHVADIGVPASLVAHVGAGAAQRMDAADLASWIRPRARGAHKTTGGHVAVLAGSPGKVGASLLVARGAMRAGAGLATIGTWPEAASAVEAHVLEAMTARIDPARIEESLDGILAGKHAAVVGPGFGLGEDARAAIEHALGSFAGPMVVDADALTTCAGRAAVLRAAKRLILTPHPGELARLVGRSPADVEADRFRAARELVAISGAVVVLKGAHTIVAGSEGRVAVSPVACPALATAGSGDVLGGVIAAMACALAPFEAACAGVMLHALAGEKCAAARAGADRGVFASEVADAVALVAAEHRAV